MAAALIGGRREVSEVANFGGEELAGVARFLEGVRGRRVGAKHKAACILIGFV